jgi:hypothetical protein
MNTNTTITRQLMRTARTLEAEWRHVLRGSVSTGIEEDESSTGRVWAARFHHVTGPFWLGARFETYELFSSLIFNYFRAAVHRRYLKPRILNQ